MAQRKIQELQGGMVLWQGDAWWLLLNEIVEVSRPQELANLLLNSAEVPPEQLSRHFDCPGLFRLDEERLARWSYQARKGLIHSDDLPDPLQLLSLRTHLPKECPRDVEPIALRIWKHLAALLGVHRTENLLAYMLLPWVEWQEREEFHKRRFKALSDFFNKNPEFASNWEFWSPGRKAEFFSQWMDRGRLTVSELAKIRIEGSLHEILRQMRDLWCGQINKPDPQLSEDYLALGLKCLDIEVPKLLPHSCVKQLLEFQGSLSEKNLRTLIKRVPLYHLDIKSVVEAEVDEETLDYVVENNLIWVLQFQATRSQRTRYLRYHRQLKKAGFQPEELEFESYLQRSDNPYIFVYLVFNGLSRPPTDPMLEALDELAPKGGFTEKLQAPPAISKLLQSELSGLAQLLDVDPLRLEEVVRLRSALGYQELPKRLARWLCSSQEQERTHLKKLMVEAPQNAALEARLAKLSTLQIADKEKVRCQKEVDSQCTKLPIQLFQRQQIRISDRLLREILGPSLFEEVPRAALFLKHTEVPISRLVELRRDHPANNAWLQRFENHGFSASHWLKGWEADLRIDGKFVEFRTETNPAEILEMGTHFKTCLSLDGDDGFNAFSVLTNLLEVNKMVMIGRNLEGTVVVRKLLGLTQNGYLVGYQTYSHLPGAKGPVHEACRQFAQRCGLTLSDDATPERILHDLDWYDDGVECWKNSKDSARLPSSWPRDQGAIRQWKTRRLVVEKKPFRPRRIVEFFHHLKQAIVPPSIDDPTTYMWQSAVEKLIFLGRYDIVAEPQFLGNPAALPASICYHGSIRQSDSNSCVALFNPEHRIYRNCNFEEGDLSRFRAPSCASICQPKILQETLSGLMRLGHLVDSSRLRDDFVELTRINYHYQPRDRGWLKFAESVLGDFMAEVASQTRIPEWESSLKNFTQRHPRNENGWLARARIEGSKILGELQHALSENRHSLKLALAVQLAGELPRQYILPRPDVLLNPLYLHQARSLACLVLPRLERLQRKGYNSRKIETAKSHLQASETAAWRHWSVRHQDAELDETLTALAVAGKLKHPGPWLKLGDVGLRADVLRLLKIELEPEVKEALWELLERGYPEASRRLTKLWLRPAFNDQGMLDLDEMLLTYQERPDILLTYLRCLDLDDSLDILEDGAEFLHPAELESLITQLWSDVEFQPEDVEGILMNQDCCIGLQQQIIQRLAGPLSEESTKTERGRWAKLCAESKFSTRRASHS